MEPTEDADAEDVLAAQDAEVSPASKAPLPPIDARVPAMVGLIALFAIAVGMLFRPTSVPPRFAPSQPDQKIAMTVELSSERDPAGGAEGAPEPLASAEAAATRARRPRPVDTPTEVQSDDPAPPPALDPAPTPAVRSPAATNPPPAQTREGAGSDSPASGQATLHVALLGLGGTAEVVGVGSKQTPAEFRLAPGTHELRLVDRDGGLLRTHLVTVRGGETSGCAWKRNGVELSLVRDPKKGPCRLQ